MNEERKQELMEYAKVLATLKSAGLNYTNETNQVIKELNKLMEFSPKELNKVGKFINNVSKDELKSGKVVVVDSKTDRCIGKTSSLISVSSELKIPIIVRNYASKMYIEQLTNVFINNKPIVHLLRDIVNGKSFPNGVLIDECVGLEGINIIDSKGIIIRGGYLQDIFLI